MKKYHLISAFIFTFVSAPAFASLQLATQKACTACHSVDKKLVGPSYKEIAAKYKKEAGAEAKLIASIQKGSVGKWGQIPMPPNRVTEGEAKTLAKWVLTQ